MRKTAIAFMLSLGLAQPHPASASVFCTGSGASLYCTGGGGYANPGDSFARGFMRGQAIASQYAMVNAYREAHGLPRCHYGILGAIMSASDGRPMC